MAHGNIGPYTLNSIITGDARELSKAIPDESVDLIFTDPVYDRIEDYRWLRELSTRVLKPTGNMLVFVNANWFKPVYDAVPSDHRPLAYIQTSGASPMNGHIIAKTYYLLWYGSGIVDGYMPDGYIGTSWSKANTSNHQWTKSPKYVKQVLRAFTLDGATILDPFTGGGTVPALCKMLGRNYLAFEIDPATAEKARIRVQNTQPPLFVPQLEQTEMVME